MLRTQLRYPKSGDTVNEAPICVTQLEPVPGVPEVRRSSQTGAPRSGGVKAQPINPMSW